MTTTLPPGPAAAPPGADLDVLRAVEAPRPVAVDGDHPPRQPGPPESAPASRSAATRRRSASMVSIMTSLWFDQLRAGDRVSVKPHASPVLHAINYLLGELDESYLTTLREFGGLQSYPSRTKDPDPVDYSTGSVGIGATAPIWGAMARRYVDGHSAAPAPGASTRWSATPNWTRARCGRRCWIRRWPNWARSSGSSTSTASHWTGWCRTSRATGCRACSRRPAGRCITVKYGRLLEELFARPGGEALRARIDEMTNPEYQRLLRCTPTSCGPAARRRAGRRADRRAARRARRRPRCTAAIRNLGGHDLAALREAFAAIDDTRPTVIFAYTIKGYGLPTQGHPQNHSALLTRRPVRPTRRRLGHATSTTRGSASPRDRPQRPAVRGDARARCARPRSRRRPMLDDPDRLRPHPERHRHHPGRARPARCSTSPARRPRRRGASSRSAPTSAPPPTSAAG